jgi:hypothetical protein
MGKHRQPRAAQGQFPRWRQLQREMQAALQARLDALLEPPPSYIEAYRDRFEREFPAWTGATLKPAQLDRRLAAADLVFVGDYHSLAQSQRTALRLLRRLRRRGVAPAIALEMLPAERQGLVDDFLAGRLSRARFRAQVQEQRLWDFPWKPVQILLDFARYHQLPVIALNHRPRRAEHALAERDRRAARLLAAVRRREPGRPLFVLYGDYHLAASHLPAACDRAFAKAGLAPARAVRVFQNREDLFWQSLGADGRAPEILDLAGGELCIQSATPLVKLQSYLHWLSFHAGEREDWAVPDPADFSEDLGAEVDVALHRIAQFLRIPLLEQAPPRVFWVGETDFALRIARAGGWRDDELALVLNSLRVGEDCYLRERDLAVIADPGENHLSELAARVLHSRCSRLSLRPRTLVDDFYLRVIRHALMFLGSKLMNPLRKSQDRPALLRYLREDGPGGDWRGRAELLLAYLEAEERFQHSGEVEGFASRFFNLEPRLHLALTRAVGRSLGSRLHDALIADRLDPIWLRTLWFEPFRLEGSPLKRYIEILEQLAQRHGAARAAGELERL